MLSVLDWLIQLIGGSGSPESRIIADYRKERAEAKAWANRREAMAAAAQADILVLAALHDGVITHAEREELAARLPSLPASADVETTPEALIQRWNDRQETMQSDHDLSRTVESLAHWLTPPQKERLFDAIAQLGRADASEEAPRGPYRGGASGAGASTVRVFGTALRIDEAEIARAEHR